MLAAWCRVHIGARTARKEAVRAAWDGEGRGCRDVGGNKGQAGCEDRETITKEKSGQPLSREGACSLIRMLEHCAGMRSKRVNGGFIMPSNIR